MTEKTKNKYTKNNYSAFLYTINDFECEQLSLEQFTQHVLSKEINITSGTIPKVTDNKHGIVTSVKKILIVRIKTIAVKTTKSVMTTKKEKYRQLFCLMVV